jgi:ABC-type molybdenum transport system ATPase subunit/photorepair protein PhrA
MQFEEKKVLEGLSLKVEPQERLVIMGQSGGGKSTMSIQVCAYCGGSRNCSIACFTRSAP